ncbi:MAG TPA: rhodanese-like domain-containing protein [Chloroflexia bacterium]|nr:rhodanese-like domain-containing protein [Chloroflexia bacterium]
MYFKQFLREDLGCASYLVGDTDAGECVVVDPQWDVSDYLRVAADKGLRITHAIETHNHADHVSGHGKLAQAGAQVAIHEEAGVEYPHLSLKDGDTVHVGVVSIKVLHTPGHRPEHIALSISDTSRADEPWLVLTGDSLFVGDVARPDLAVEAEEGAALLYRALQDRLLSLGDGVEVYPAHVSGSLCGRSMSAKGSSTIGFERQYNGALKVRDQDSFVGSLMGELPPQPPHFKRIVERNRGPFYTEELVVRALSVEEVDMLRRDGAIVLDTRSSEAFGGGHIPGALNVDMHKDQFPTRASWVLPPDKDVVLVLPSDDDLGRVVSSMAAVGQTVVKGYLLGGMATWDSSGRHIESVRQLPVAELHERIEAGSNPYTVLDVREPSEWREGHIEGAINIPFHQLASHIDEVPSNKPVATVCGAGNRSSIAASILKREGFEPVNIAGGMDAWKGAGYEVKL